MAGVKVVGLTGGIGSGKTAAARCFAAQGVAVVDTDELSHALTAPGGRAIPTLVARFGPDFQRADGALDRLRMRELVFRQPSARRELEAILHPMILEDSLAALAGAQGPYAVLVVPLLFESQAYRDVVDRTLLIDCDEEVQVARVMQRSGLSESQVHAIMATQMPRGDKRRLADDIIDNSGSLSELALQVEAKHRYYLSSLARARSQ
ncbi:dephospho-CoA kinase [Pseudogulbenkiania sp. NH8B]|uniref:dephospho-CoA kinase n=1 Tax=Pseudogulbenkiania sp. (strain NH8B) TaxID=748280 RepID=UPI000227A524|nr:dephospho-CoA kinase [Pseudogulbenkiania sp. NH8B]BAK78262.1 dephospho-CoA kinase [Pseudogulbenkiania sp. NH8B]